MEGELSEKDVQSRHKKGAGTEDSRSKRRESESQAVRKGAQEEVQVAQRFQKQVCEKEQESKYRFC